MTRIGAWAIVLPAVFLAQALARDLRSTQAHVLVALGDRDGVRLEHVVELYRLIPNSQLAEFPNGDHFMPHLAAEKLFPTVAAFLDSPRPDAKTDRGN
jgi:pimeloyl-ACP methyl ester carboxylesterase